MLVALSVEKAGSIKGSMAGDFASRKAGSIKGSMLGDFVSIKSR